MIKSGREEKKILFFSVLFVFLAISQLKTQTKAESSYYNHSNLWISSHLLPYYLFNTSFFLSMFEGADADMLAMLDDIELDNSSQYQDYTTLAMQTTEESADTTGDSTSRYYQDLDIEDRTIFDRYERSRDKYFFMRPPVIGRDRQYKQQLRDISPKGYSYKGTLDNSGDTMRANETFNGKYDIDYQYPLNLDTYLAGRKQKLQAQIWDSLTSGYDVKKALSRGDLAFLLGQATGFAIPLPPNPVLNIFGKPELSINVNGQVNVSIGWEWRVQNLGSMSSTGSTQSSPFFRQDVRVNVGAKIGDKLKFNIDQNTRNQFDFDNKFKLGYEGYEDDIIKRIDVGNISFNIPSILIGGASELFGVSGTFQFGPLYLQAFASQRRGQKKMVNVNGGTSKQYFSLHAYQFAENHFFLDTAYKAVYNEYFKNSTPLIPKSASSLRIKQIQVWEASTDLTNANIANAVAIADLPGKRRKMGEDWDASIKQATIKTGSVEKGRFMLLDSMNYIIDYNLGTLTFKNFRRDRYYAVSYRVEGQSTDTLDDVYYGYFSDQIGLKDTLILKLVYRPNLLPTYKTLWSRQMKNKYNIGSSNVNINDTYIGVWYTRKTNDSTDLLEGASDKIVTILGVDRVTNSTGAAPPDGQFDINIGAFFDQQRGEITFPHTEPFGDGLRDYFSKIGNPELAEMYVYDQIYDTTIEVSRKNTARDRFIISGEMTGKTNNSRINLNAYNLSPGSVKVTLDGVLLRENDDYIVDYYTGALTMRNQRAMQPNANLVVEYEQQDVFTSSTKTMYGVRADYELFKNRNMTAKLGGTFIRYQQAKISDRARLGDEPIANSMLGFDFNMNMNAPWITSILDKLPFYDTKAPSSINLFGEWAMVMPTPNRVTSEISSDNNEPVVEIDNFENVIRQISFGMTPSQWQHGSQPILPQLYGLDPNMSEIEQSDTVSRYRGRLFWYQYPVGRVPRKDVYPKEETYQTGTQYINALYVEFNPAYRGIYNKNASFLDSNNAAFNPNDTFYSRPENKGKVWAGFQRLVPSYSSNFDNENIEYIDLMINIEYMDVNNAKMYIDIGMISEDIIPNGIGDTEDGITDANPLPNGITDEGEDVGIDAMDNAREKETYPPPLNEEADPARDDFYFDFSKSRQDRDNISTNDYIKYNNFEGNSSAEIGLFPDKEMINPVNGSTLSLDNSYFTYEVKLQHDHNADNPQVVGGNLSKNWIQYRIPVRKPDAIIGNPQFSNIQYIRVRFAGGYAKLIIADWKFVGTTWQRMSNFQDNFDPNDSTLSISYVNLWENSGAPNYYIMPPGVSPPRMLSNSDNTYDARQNEQSLSLSVKNLRWGEERMAVKIFNDYDLFNYKKMKFFLHGDGSMPFDVSAGSKAKGYAFIRFGIDSGNYYEYRRPLIKDWQEIEINLADLTAIKQVRDTMMLSDRQTFPVPNDPYAHFTIKGNPILTKVKFVGLGIANPSDAFQELTTTMWVNELRLLSPESSKDWAGIATFSSTLADLGTVNMSFSNREPNFHGLTDRYGTRSRTRDWNIVLTGNAEKFAPPSFKQAKIPIAYQHSESMENPKYVASSDIELEAAAAVAYRKAIDEGQSPAAAEQAAEDVKTRSQTLKVQDGWSLTGVKLGIPVKHWLVNETVNRLTTTYAYSQIFERSPIYQERFSWVWRLNVGYTLPIPDLLTVKPLASSIKPETAFIGAYKDWKLNFLPSNFAFNLDMQRRRQTEQSRYLDMPSPVVREFSANRGMNFNWKLSQGGFLSPTFDYSFVTGSTMVPFELDEFGRQRTGSQISDQIFFNNGFIDLGSNNTHQQNVTMNIKPILPNIIGLNRFIDMTGSYTSNYQWQDPLQSDPAIADAAKSASVNSSIRFNLALKLKDMGNSIFGAPQATFGAGKAKTGTTPEPPKSILSDIASVVQTIFFDWDRINFAFTQSNASVNPGVYGGTGFDNFWGRTMTFRDSEMSRGPSTAYQLGLISNPHGAFHMVKSSAFPWFKFETETGLRPPNAVFQDNFNQQSNFDIKTSRPLWKGATLDLNWKTSRGYNRNQTVDTDEFGNPTFSNIIAMDNLNKTFFTGPSFFGLHTFGNSIDNVVDIFNEKRVAIDNSDMDDLSKNQALHRALSESFYEGLEAFSITSGEIGKFLPNINWGLRWEGLEKWGIWNDLVKRMSVEHAYNSMYVETAQITDNGRSVTNQTVNYGFAPLFGVSASFDEKIMKGVLTASLKWSETTAYSATTASGAIVSVQHTTDITAQASYVLKGFSFPLFGINLKNDLEFSFIFTYKDNNTGTYDVLDRGSFTGDNANGRTLTGNTQFVVEPRARYNISQLVTAAFFMRYEGTFNEGAANPGYHTIRVGLDIVLNISGGR